MVTWEQPFCRRSWASICVADSGQWPGRRGADWGLGKERGTNETGRASAEHEHAGAETGANLVETVARAGSRFDQGGIDITEVVYLEDLALGVGAVLGEAAAEGSAVAGPLGDVSKRLLAT